MVTNEETEMVLKTVQAVDAVIAGMVEGHGIWDWEMIQRDWFYKTQDLRRHFNLKGTLHDWP